MSQPIQQQQQQGQQHNVAIDVAQQIGQKQPPTNQQISELVGITQNFIDQKKNDPNASQQSVKAITDLQGVLQATEQLNQNKNQDESLQKIILETGAAGSEVAQTGKQAMNDPNVQSGGQQVKEQGKQLTQAVWSLVRQMVQSGEFRSQINSFVKVFQEMFNGLSDQAQQQGQSMGEVVQQKAQETRQQGLSEDQKHKISGNLLTALRKFNQNSQLRSGFQQLTYLFKDLANEESYPTGQSAPHQQLKDTVQQSEHVDTAFQESKKLLENFSGRPIDPFLEKNRALFAYVRNHEQARDWLNRFSAFITEAFDKPEELEEEEFTQRSESLVNEAYNLAQEPEFRAKSQDTFDEMKTIAASIRDDEDVRNLQQQTATFLDNFTTVGPNGERQFNTDLMKELQTFVVPLVLAQLDNIPIPPVDGSNKDYDYHFDNMILRGQEIVPDSVKIHSQSDTQLNLRDLNADNANTRIFLEIASVQVRVDNVHFQFTRKTFPKMSDDGVANVHIDGDQGFSLRIELRASMNQQGAPEFHLNDVNCNIQRLKIDIVEAKHQVLLKMFTSIYQNRVKMMAQQSVEQKIREIFARIEGGLNSIFARFPPSKLKDMVSQRANQALNAGSSGTSGNSGSSGSSASQNVGATAASTGTLPASSSVNIPAQPITSTVPLGTVDASQPTVVQPTVAQPTAVQPTAVQPTAVQPTVTQTTTL